MHDIKENLLNFSSANLQKLQLVMSVLQEFGITSIGYSRFYKNKCIRISNNIEWMEYYLNNDVLHTDKLRYVRELTGSKKQKYHIILRAQDNWSKEINPIMKKYNQDNICSFYMQNDNYIEMFGFASDVGTESLTNFYINNISLLLRYTLFFREVMLPQINNNLDKILIPFAPFNDDTIDADIENATPEKKIKLKRIYLTDNTYVTEKEFISLHYLSKGYSYKEIGQKLSISPRTVETYINHIRLKLGYTFKGDILHALEKSLIKFNN